MRESLTSLEQSERLSEVFAAALRRAQSEFLEMPGLQLTDAQAARLWSFGYEPGATNR